LEQQKNITPEQLLLRITCGFWLFTKVFSWKVWVTERLFPLAPVTDYLYNIPAWVHVLLLGSSLLLLAVLVIKPSFKALLPILLISELLSCLLDQNRWQPWEYQFIITVFIFIINKNNYAHIKYMIAFLLAATYLYSGLQKMNEGFLYVVWDKMILHYFLHRSYQHSLFVHYSGYVLAITEALGGFCLLFSKTQRKAAIFLIAMHIFNLLFLGPRGIDYNPVVWGWNMLMSIYLYLLFIHTPTSNITFLLVNQGWNKTVFILLGICPALNFIGLWDNYLSNSLYSGKLPLMAVCVNDTTALKELKPYLVKKDNLHFCDSNTVIYTQKWAMTEMNVPPYPEERVYRKIKTALTAKYPAGSCSVCLYYYQ